MSYLNLKDRSIISMLILEKSRRCFLKWAKFLNKLQLQSWSQLSGSNRNRFESCRAKLIKVTIKYKAYLIRTASKERLLKQVKKSYLIIEKIEWLRRFLEELTRLLREVHQCLLEVNLTLQAVIPPDVKITYRGWEWFN